MYNNNYKKNYLNAEERDDVLTLKFITIVAQKILKQWGERSNLNESETNLLENSIKSNEDFFKLLGKRLDKSEIQKLNKSIKGFSIKKIDQYQMDKIFREAEDRIKTAVIERAYFESWCEEIMDIRCKGCTKNWKECTLHNVFESNLVPEPTGYENNNCRYSYNPDVNFKKTIESGVEIDAF